MKRRQRQKRNCKRDGTMRLFHLFKEEKKKKILLLKCVANANGTNPDLNQFKCDQRGNKPD